MDAASSMIEKAIVANPTYAEAYNNLGSFLSPSLSIMIYVLCASLLSYTYYVINYTNFHL